ncbi:MAG: hypothetical protein QM690_16240 [Sphingobium sp.]
MDTKLHAVTDANGCPLSFFMTAGQISDYIGAAALLDDLPKAQWLLADRATMLTGFETLCRPRVSSPAFLAENPATSPSNMTNAASYKRRNRIEIMFGRLKDWRRIATRYDRCPTAFFSAISLAATVIFWR